MRVKIFCQSCDGKGYVEEKAYPKAEIIKTICPQCEGQKYVHGETVEVQK